MNPEQYKSYWKIAAIKHKSIMDRENDPHFCTYGVEHILSELRNINSPALVLEDPEYRPADGLSDNVMLQMSGAVLVLKKCITGDWADVELAKAEMFNIAWDMMTKLQNDRRKAFNIGRPDPESLIKHLDINSIELVPVGPVFDGWHGWRLNHVVKTNKSDRLDPNNWDDETPWMG